jgi:hypothetical protein
LERLQIKAKRRRYWLYVTNGDWRQLLFFIPHPEAWGFAWYYGFGGHAFLNGPTLRPAGSSIRDNIGTPPRTLAYLWAHELTHVIAWEHIGLDRLHVPRWVWEGLPDYVGIENRESYEQLQNALGARPVDIPMED